MPRPRSLREDTAKSRDVNLDVVLAHDNDGKIAYIEGRIEDASNSFQSALESLKATEQHFLENTLVTAKTNNHSVISNSTTVSTRDSTSKNEDDDEYSSDEMIEDDEDETESQTIDSIGTPNNSYSMLNFLNSDQNKPTQDLIALKGDLLVSLANCNLDMSRSYSAYKIACEAVKLLSSSITTINGSSSKQNQQQYGDTSNNNGVSNNPQSQCPIPMASFNLDSGTTEARLIRARSITSMERRDEMYYDDEEEHSALIAEAVTDLHSVLHNEPTNQPAKNELAFLMHLKKKAEKDAEKQNNARRYFGDEKDNLNNPGLTRSSSLGRLGALKVLVDQEAGAAGLWLPATVTQQNRIRGMITSEESNNSKILSRTRSVGPGGKFKGSFQQKNPRAVKPNFQDLDNHNGGNSETTSDQSFSESHRLAQQSQGRGTMQYRNSPRRYTQYSSRTNSNSKYPGPGSGVRALSTIQYNMSTMTLQCRDPNCMPNYNFNGDQNSVCPDAISTNYQTGEISDQNLNQQYSEEGATDVVNFSSKVRPKSATARFDLRSDFDSLSNTPRTTAAPISARRLARQNSSRKNTATQQQLRNSNSQNERIVIDKTDQSQEQTVEDNDSLSVRHEQTTNTTNTVTVQSSQNDVMMSSSTSNPKASNEDHSNKSGNIKRNSAAMERKQAQENRLNQIDSVYSMKDIKKTLLKRPKSASLLSSSRASNNTRSTGNLNSTHQNFHNSNQNQTQNQNQNQSQNGTVSSGNKAQLRRAQMLYGADSPKTSSKHRINNNNNNMQQKLNNFSDYSKSPFHYSGGLSLVSTFARV